MKPVDGLEREKRSPSEIHKDGKWNQCNEKGLHETVKQNKCHQIQNDIYKKRTEDDLS